MILRFLLFLFILNIYCFTSIAQAEELQCEKYLNQFKALSLKAKIYSEGLFISEQKIPFSISFLLKIFSSSHEDKLEIFTELRNKGGYGLYFQLLYYIRAFTSIHSRIIIPPGSLSEVEIYFHANPFEIRRLIHDLGIMRPTFFSRRLQWVSPRSLTKHFKKHASEFTFRNEDEYLASAQDFLIDPDPIHLIVRRNENTWIKYCPVSRRLVIVEGDYITTYYVLTESYRPFEEFASYLGLILSK